MPIPHLLGLIKPENVTLVPLIINGRLHPQASCLAQVNNQSNIERIYSDLLVVLKIAQPFTSTICKIIVNQLSQVEFLGHLRQKASSMRDTGQSLQFQDCPRRSGRVGTYELGPMLVMKSEFMTTRMCTEHVETLSRFLLENTYSQAR